MGCPGEVLRTLYIRSSFCDVAMSTHETSQQTIGGVGKANITACLTVLGLDGKPWIRVQREGRHGDAVWPSGEATFVSAPTPENHGMSCVSRSFL